MIPKNLVVTSLLGNAISNPTQTGKGCEVCPLAAVGIPAVCAHPGSQCLCPPGNHHSSSTGLMSSAGRAGGAHQQGTVPGWCGYPGAQAGPVPPAPCTSSWGGSSEQPKPTEGGEGSSAPCWLCSRCLREEEEEGSSSCPLTKQMWDSHCQGLDLHLGTQQHLKGFPRVNLSKYSEVNETLELCSTLELRLPQLHHGP